MTTLKTKLSFVAILVALLGAGLSKVKAADELWRPDKQTGVQISPMDCISNPNEQCGLLYHENSETPFAVLDGDYIN